MDSIYKSLETARCKVIHHQCRVSYHSNIALLRPKIDSETSDEILRL